MTTDPGTRATVERVCAALRGFDGEPGHPGEFISVNQAQEIVRETLADTAAEALAARPSDAHAAYERGFADAVAATSWGIRKYLRERGYDKAAEVIEDAETPTAAHPDDGHMLAVWPCPTIALLAQEQR